MSTKPSAGSEPEPCPDANMHAARRVICTRCRSPCSNNSRRAARASPVHAFCFPRPRTTNPCARSDRRPAFCGPTTTVASRQRRAGCHEADGRGTRASAACALDGTARASHLQATGPGVIAVEQLQPAFPHTSTASATRRQRRVGTAYTPKANGAHCLPGWSLPICPPYPLPRCRSQAFAVDV